MSRRRRRIAAAAGVAALIPLIILAQVPILTGPPSAPVGASWPGAATVVYRLNNQIGPGMPNLEPGSTPVAAINASLGSVSAATGLNVVNGGPTPVSSAGVDGTNLITFASTPQNQALLQGSVGFSVTFFNAMTGQVFESDVIGNGNLPFSTLGTPGFHDVESLVLHQVAHGAGLDHSALFNASLFPTSFTGTLKGRTLSRDDLAGFRSIYGGIPAASGTVTGAVVRAGTAPVPGAHLLLEDAITGRVVLGALSLADGTFTLPDVPPGLYHLYVEPLDGPVTPGDLLGPYWSNVSVDTGFRTTALGGALSPTVLVVHQGENVDAGSIQVGGPAPVRNVSQVFYNTTPTPFGAVSFLERLAPFGGYMGIFGSGVHAVPDAGFSISGPFLRITGPSTWASSQQGFDDRIFPLSVAAGTPPGAYVLHVTDPTTGDLVVFPGCLEVLPGPTPAAYAAPYGPSCPASAGPVTLSAAGPPVLGNSTFGLNVTGTPAGRVVVFLFSLAPDHVLLPGGCVLGVDLGDLLVPLPGIMLSASGPTTSIAMPLPADPGLSGLDVFVQAFVLDPAVPSGVGISNALAVHLE